MYRKSIIFSVTLFYTLIIIILSFAPLSGLPNLNTGFDDKIAHFLMYALFCFFWFLTFHCFKKRPSLLLALVCSIIFGMIIELLQSKLFIYRSTDFLDFLANTLGALSMTLVLYLKKEVIVKKL